jgi:hypothetical protein
MAQSARNIKGRQERQDKDKTTKVFKYSFRNINLLFIMLNVLLEITNILY